MNRRTHWHVSWHVTHVVVAAGSCCDGSSRLVDTVTTMQLLESGPFVRELPPPADVVMETLFWGSISLSLLLTHSHNAAVGCYCFTLPWNITVQVFHATPTLT